MIHFHAAVPSNPLFLTRPSVESKFAYETAEKGYTVVSLHWSMRVSRSLWSPTADLQLVHVRCIISIEKFRYLRYFSPVMLTVICASNETVGVEERACVGNFGLHA